MSKKGSKEERDLVRMLWKEGFAAMRAPSSGSATNNPLPDVIAGNSKKYLAIEVKSTSLERIYINKEQIDALEEFSRIFGAQPIIGAKFNYTKWRFLKPKELQITRNNNYRIDKNHALLNGIEFDELVGKDKQLKL